MKIRIASDLHNEFKLWEGYENFAFPPLPDDKETVLVLAGDIGSLALPITWNSFITQCSEQFKYVFWIAGNHEYYSGNLDRYSIKSAIDYLGLNNVYTNKLILEREKVAIIGDTLWTDFDGADFSSMEYAQRGMNDFYLIRVGSDDKSKLHPARTVVEHDKQKKRIFEDVDYYSGLGFKCVVVTHHAPSLQSIGVEYRGDPLNPAFASDMVNDIKRYNNIDYWIHGHVHGHFDYMIGYTRIICNPKGYRHEDNTEFNETLTIEL